MAQKKERNKLKASDWAKKEARYNMKCEEFNKLDLDELRRLFRETKMSSTDKYALIKVVDTKLAQNATDEIKKIKENINNEEKSEENEISDT